MGNGRQLPNIAGCAFGFAAAGSGVGSLVGTALGPWLCPLPGGQPTHDERVLAMYGGTYLGIMVGIALGAVAGVAYAVLVRRARRRLPPPEAGTAG